MFKKLIKKQIIDLIEDKVSTSPEHFFFILKLLKDKDLIKYHLDDSNFIKTIGNIAEYIIDQEIEVPEVEEKIIEIGNKYGILDVSLDDYAASSLKIYCFYVMLKEVLFPKDMVVKFSFVTDEEALLESAHDLEKEYGVLPINRDELNKEGNENEYFCGD